MSGPSIHELLGLPVEITQPNAYQVFGLQLGEADQQVIRAAIEQRIITLREAKSSVSPAVWTTAARAVQTAQKVLTHPQKKAALDAQYGIINEPEPAPPAAVDPLAALLPGTGVSASSANTTSPGTTPSGDSAPSPATAAPDSARWQPASAAQPTAPAQATAAPTNLAPPSPAQAIVPTVARRRPTRRRSSWAGPAFNAIILLLMASVVGVLGYLFFSGGEIQVSKNDSGFQISTGRTESNANRAEGNPNRTVTAPPREETRKPQANGIMKPPPTLPPRQSNDPRQGIAAEDRMPVLDFQAGMDSSSNPTAGTDSDMSDNMLSIPKSPASPNSTPDSPPTPPTPSPPPPSPPPNSTSAPTPPAAMPTPDPTPPPTLNKPAATAAEIAAGEAAIAAARAAVTGAQWESMKQLAETAQAKAATEQQQQNAATLYQFADLATFYRGAVSRAMADLSAGNEFSLTDSLTFLVQQSSAEHITLYRNKREYPYSLAELPLSVAHALAPFQLDIASPEGQAAKAVFQAISPLATPGHRSESVGVLRALESVQGADPKRLADFIESLK